jgi:hypothetical protein
VQVVVFVRCLLQRGCLWLCDYHHGRKEVDGSDRVSLFDVWAFHVSDRSPSLREQLFDGSTMQHKKRTAELGSSC